MENKYSGITIVSIPRCGSTMLWRSLLGLKPGDITDSSFTSVIDKKHMIYPSELKKGTNLVIFLFGNPFLAVESTIKNRTGALHLKNCNYKGNTFPDIRTKDYLNYELIFDTWTKPNKVCDVVCLRYENLFELSDSLRNYLPDEFKTFTLPPYTPRQTKEINLTTIITYRPLDKKIEKFQDFAYLPRLNIYD